MSVFSPVGERTRARPRAACNSGCPASHLVATCHGGARRTAVLTADRRPPQTAPWTRRRLTRATATARRTARPGRPSRPAQAGGGAPRRAAGGCPAMCAGWPPPAQPRPRRPPLPCLRAAPAHEPEHLGEEAHLDQQPLGSPQHTTSPQVQQRPPLQQQQYQMPAQPPASGSPSVGRAAPAGHLRRAPPPPCHSAASRRPATHLPAPPRPAAARHQAAQHAARRAARLQQPGAAQPARHAGDRRAQGQEQAAGGCAPLRAARAGRLRCGAAGAPLACWVQPHTGGERAA
jgi:hypothetical protein